MKYIDKGRRRRLNTAAKRRWRERTGSGKYGRHTWTEAEKERVLAQSVPDAQLASELGVSVTAIQAKRWHLQQEEGKA